MKRICVCLLMFFMISCTVIQPCYGAEAGDITVFVNGEMLNFDVAPVIEDGRTLVPVRGIFEAVDMQVEWYPETYTVYAHSDKDTIEMRIGDVNATVNGNACILDVPARIIHSRTLVPARFIAESLDCMVDWDSEARRVLIDYRPDTDFEVTIPSSLKKENPNGYGVSLKKVVFKADYNDKYFVQQSKYGNGYSYIHNLAQSSLALELSTLKGESDATGQSAVSERTSELASVYDKLGFSDVRHYNYDKSVLDSGDKAAYSIASKTLYDGSNLVNISIRAGGYGAEWRSNFNVGNGKHHAGFEAPAKEIYNSLSNYLASGGFSPETTRVWITGFSRGGAVGNILAAMIDESTLVLPANLYAYLFAVPNNVNLAKAQANAEKYGNIHNINLPSDAVTRLVMSEWGWGRYGVTHTVVNRNPYPTDKNVTYFYKLTGSKFDYDITAADVESANKLSATLAELFTSSDKYAASYQGFAMDIAEWGFFRAGYLGESYGDFVAGRYGSSAKMPAAQECYNSQILPLLKQADSLSALFGQTTITGNKELMDVIYNTTILMSVNGVGASEIVSILLNLVTSGMMSSFTDGGLSDSLTKSHMPEYYLSWIMGYDSADMYQ